MVARKPFAFVLFFCLVNTGFITFSSKTRSIEQTKIHQHAQQQPLKMKC